MNLTQKSDLRHRLRRRRFLFLMADAARRDMRHDWTLGWAPLLLHAGYSRRNLRNADSAVIGRSRLSVSATSLAVLESYGHCAPVPIHA